MIVCRKDPIILSDFTLNNLNIQETIHFILMFGDNMQIQSHVSLNCILCLKSPGSAICVFKCAGSNKPNKKHSKWSLNTE